MANTLITEAGDTLKMETVFGIAQASSLNDISVVNIIREDFSENPANNGWLFGSEWEWDSTNYRIKVA